MVDSVIIQGSTPGAFAPALEGIPPWASEETLGNIKGILLKSQSIQAGSLEVLKKMAQTVMNQEVFDELEQAIKDVTKDMGKEHEAHKKKDKDDKEDLDHHKKMTPLYKLLTDKTYFLAAAFSSAIAISKLMIMTLVNNVNTFDKLYQSGIAVKSSSDGAVDAFDALRQMSMDASMSIDRFGKVVEKSAGANIVGLTKFAKALPASQKALLQFGFDSQQAAELQGAYLDSLVGFANIQTKSGEEISQGAAAFGKSITRLSFAVGMSRQKLLENTAAITQSTDANVIAATVGEESATKFAQFVAGFKDQNVGQQFLKMMSSKLPGLNSTFQNFAKAGLGNLGMHIMRFTKGLEGLSPERAALATKDFVDGLGNIDAVINQQQMLAEAGVEGAQENLAILVGLRQQANAAKKLNLKEIEDNEKAAEQSAKIRSAWMGITVTFSNIFAPTVDDLAWLAKYLEIANKGLKEFAEWMTTYTLFQKKDKDGKPIKGTGVTAATIAKWGGLLIGGLAALGATISVLTLVVKTWSRKKDILDNISGRNRGGGAGGGGGGGGGGQKGPGLMSRLGTGIGDLGKGIGRGIGGLGAGIGRAIESILTGLAKGLLELGNPKVLVGVVALAGMAGTLWIAGKALQEFATVPWTDLAKAGVVLVALGLAGAAAGAGPVPLMILAGAAAFAAMGGALWIIGKGIQEVGPGLKTLSDGIKSFGDIDGNNLIQVATGIAALSGSLVLFAAGAAAGGIGASIGAVTGIFARMFGDGSVITQLKAFAEIGPGLTIAASAIGMLAKNIADLSAALNSFAGSDKLAEISRVTNGAQLTKNASMSVSNNPIRSTINSPSAVSANPDNVSSTGSPSRAPSQQIGPGLEKPPATSDINSVLTYQSSILEQLLLSTNNNLSVNKDILRYAKNHS
jgi:hypothetical protein